MPHSSLSAFRGSIPQNHGVSTAPKQTKAQRQAEQRAAQLESFKKKQSAAKRGRVAVIALSILGAVAVAALVTTVIVINIQPKPDQAGLLDNVQTFSNLESTHVEGTVDYAMSPPAGGPHNAVWLNCGIYDQPVPNENAVHDLEHGSIWITYAPDLPQSDIDKLKAKTPSTYAVLSPYTGLDSPIAISAWGAQLKLTDTDDPALQAFIDKYWQSADSPEPGAPCTGGVDAPGKE
ncbi:MAG: hypothetical protein JWP32_1859 [Schumannella sp.]|nr:hypothetical protein [Schumannella sp.]